MKHITIYTYIPNFLLQSNFFNMTQAENVFLLKILSHKPGTVLSDSFLYPNLTESKKGDQGNGVRQVQKLRKAVLEKTGIHYDRINGAKEICLGGRYKVPSFLIGHFSDGYTKIPVWLIQKYHELNLNNTQLIILLRLMSFNGWNSLSDSIQFKEFGAQTMRATRKKLVELGLISFSKIKGTKESFNYDLGKLFGILYRGLEILTKEEKSIEEENEIALESDLSFIQFPAKENLKYWDTGEEFRKLFGT